MSLKIEAPTATDLYALTQGDHPIVHSGDRIPGYEGWKNRDFIAGAKRFVFDDDATMWLLTMAHEHRDLIYEMKEFALCPYERVVLETGSCHLGDPQDTAGVFVLLCTGRKVNVAFLDTRQGQFFTLPELDERWVIREYSVLIALAFYLALAAKKTHVIAERPTRKAQRRGRKLLYFGHSTIKIDLISAKQLKRSVSTGTHATPRRHQVMGHFVHRGGQRGCIHQWEKVTRDPDDGVPRWECQSCERKRTWRKAFERGDAGKGYVHQKYEVTANG